MMTGEYEEVYRPNPTEKKGLPVWPKHDVGEWTVSGDVRDYKCPKCGGEFNEWEKTPGNNYSDGTTGGIDVCPFCGTRKMEYGKD